MQSIELGKKGLIWIYLFQISMLGVFAQQGSLASIEKRLSKLSSEILMGDSLELKLEYNKEFSKILFETLQRADSYTYPFDSLNTISILASDDNAFRIFTWHIRNHQNDVYFGEEAHYYFGFVQRKYLNSNGGIEYIVIPLMELDKIPGDVENRILDNEHWLGAQYYEPKYLGKIPSYIFKQYTNRFYKGKQVKEKQKRYILLGWNGSDNTSNFKVVDVMSFDPNDKSRIIFGADIFYFDMIPKFRGIFKYSENAPFSLNYAYVKAGLFGLGKKIMIVYDHLAMPNQGAKMQSLWEVGPDGSYDGLLYYKKGAYFEWYRNVKLAEKYNNKFNRKQMEAIREREKKKLEEAGIDLFGSK